MEIVEEYKEVIANRNVYITSPNLEKKSIFPASFRFFPKMIHVFIYANKLTKKNKYDRYNWVNSSKMIMDALEQVGLKFEIDGMDNLSSFDGPAIFIGNHMSALETVVLPRIICPKKLVTFVTKQELNTIPLFGPINSARHPIIVGRENARNDLVKVMEQGAARLNEGRSIVLFPQKTRSKIFDVKNFNSLGVKLAKKNNVPVVPIALLTNAWRNGKIVKDFGKIDTKQKVYISFGKPIRITGNGSEQQTEVIKFIKTHLKKWKMENLVLE